MVLRIYWTFAIIGIIGMIISSIFKMESQYNSLSKKHMEFVNNVLKAYDDYLIILYYALFILYNVFVIGYCIIEKHSFFIIIPCLFILAVIFTFINAKFKEFAFLTLAIEMLLYSAWIGYFIIFSVIALERPLRYNTITQKCDCVQTIDILEFSQAPYNSITGSRYYIKSTPSNAYYYEVETENGGKTTKVIDGSNNYVEKFESDEYINNPHIEVYRNYTIEHYISWYGNEVTEETSSSYSYFIYYPKNGMFYEE